MVFRLWSLLLILFYISPARAELEITIYYPRTASELEALSYSIDTVDPEKLNTVSSLNNVQSGPEGQMTSTFLRGTNSNHTLLTLNGIPIKDASTPTGTDDIGQHSLSFFDTATVIKGPMSHKYGADAIGGVIDLQTRPNLENSITATIGENDHYTQLYKIGKQWDNTIIDIRYENDKSDSISVLDDNENDPYKNKNYSVQTETFLDGKSLLTSFINTENTSHLDTAGSVPNYTSDWDFNNYYISLQSKKYEFTLNHSSHDRLYNKDGVKDVYQSDRTMFYNSYTYSHGSTDYTLNSEIELVDVDFNTAINGYTSSVQEDRINKASAISIAHQHGDSIISGGLRLDKPETFEDQLTGRIGYFYNGYRVSLSNGFKAPTLYELYGTDNYGFVGNKDLTPEKSKTFEIGYKNNLLDFALYKTEIENGFLYQSNTYVNDTKKSYRKGAELDLTHSIGPVNITNKLGYSIAEDSNGDKLKRRPKWMNTLSVNYDMFTLDATYYGNHLDTHSSTYKTIEMPEKIIYNLNAQHDVLGLTMFGKLSNITDEDYERPHGYNQNGRTLTLGFKKTF